MVGPPGYQRGQMRRRPSWGGCGITPETEATWIWRFCNRDLRRALAMCVKMAGPTGRNGLPYNYGVNAYVKAYHLLESGWRPST